MNYLVCNNVITAIAHQGALTTDGTSFQDVQCGWSHCLALSSSNEIFTWGLNAHGQLGLGDIKARSMPEKVDIVTSTNSNNSGIEYDQIACIGL